MCQNVDPAKGVKGAREEREGCLNLIPEPRCFLDSFLPLMPKMVVPQHTKPLHSSDWMPTSTKQMSKYGGLLPLETPKGILRPWLSCFLFRIRGTQKLGLKKTSRGCSVQHQTPDSIRYPYTAPDMRLSNLFFKTPPLMVIHHSFM